MALNGNKIEDFINKMLLYRVSRTRQIRTVDYKTINQIVTRAHRLANLIHKCFASKDPPTLVHAFTSYVRPLLEYASCVWSPYTVGLVNKVESVQRRFTKRFVCCYSLTYSLRLTKLRIENLELRRLHLDLVYVYKILFGMVETELVEAEVPTHFVRHKLNTGTRGHSLKKA